MSFQKPRGPEVVNFDDYIDLRPSAMPRDLLEPNQYYTARIKADAPTKDTYARDYLSVAFDVEHKAELTIVTIGLYLLRGHMMRRTRAVENISNLIFEYDKSDESTVGKELGYFIGIEGGVRNAGEVPRTIEVDDDEPEVPEEPIEEGLRLATVP